MKTSLQLKLGQQLTMTPQLQQAIRLLQLSTLELQTEIQLAFESNPMLALTEDDTDGNNETAQISDSNYDDFAASWTSVSSKANNYSSIDDEDDYIQRLQAPLASLRDHLLWQVNLAPLTQTDKFIAASLIDAINDDGYLAQTPTEILQGLQQQHGDIELDEVMAVLHWIQNGDPIGCGAQNLHECLLIQAKNRPTGSVWREEVITLVRDHFDLLSAKQHGSLMRKLKLSANALDDIISIIQAFNPRPGSHISSTETKYLYPDVIVKKIRGQWLVELNPDTMPKIGINSTYAAMVKRADNSTDNNYLKGQLQEARWLLKSLESRNETLLKVTRYIVSYQQNFLEYGDEAMKPLVLHDVAEAVEMHESTISRVTTNKYIHTPRGIYELKYFFSSHVDTKAGGECSSTAIRSLIKKLIAEENSHKPLSDCKIALLLQEQGIEVARRTIAKYRESLRIPSSSERKRI